MSKHIRIYQMCYVRPTSIMQHGARLPQNLIADGLHKRTQPVFFSKYNVTHLQSGYQTSVSSCDMKELQKPLSKQMKWKKRVDLPTFMTDSLMYAGKQLNWILYQKYWHILRTMLAGSRTSGCELMLQIICSYLPIRYRQ